MPPLAHRPPHVLRALHVALLALVPWAALGTTACSLFVTAEPDPGVDAGPDDDDVVVDAGPDPAAPTIVAIDGDGSERAVVVDRAGAGVAAAHRVRDALVVTGTHLTGAQSAQLVPADGSARAPLDLELVPVSPESDVQLRLRLPSTLVPALYTLVIVTAAGSARADLTLLQGEPGHASRVRTATLARSDPRCSFGGIAVAHGVDDNDSGVLDDDEVDGEDVVCALAPVDSAIVCDDTSCVSTRAIVAPALTTDTLTVTGDATVDTLAAAEITASASMSAPTVTASASMSAPTVSATTLRQGTRLVPGLITTTEVVSVTTEAELRAALASANGTRITPGGFLDIVVQNDIALQGANALGATHPDGSRIRVRGVQPSTTITAPTGEAGIVVNTGLRLADLTLASAGGDAAGLSVNRGAHVVVEGNVTVRNFVSGAFVRSSLLEVKGPLTLVGADLTRGAGLFATENGAISVDVDAAANVDISGYFSGVLASVSASSNAVGVNIHDVGRAGFGTLGGVVRADDVTVTAVDDGFVGTLGGVVTAPDALLTDVAARGAFAQDNGVVFVSNVAFGGTAPSVGHLVADRNGYAFAAQFATAGARAVATSAGVAAFVTTLPCSPSTSGVCVDD